ncbi:FAD-binding oxidoreductase [Shimia sp. MMG029]|uniref:FAD-binding oxidoreductase n=1 Tax=Shimia sp. MMG029 TaxID=3021978 RepID=UPI0022FDDF6A|nr:pyridoxamine 5'-phosphate oxidase family protein [Shimia sp. MMG029]MDA5557817.1 pyridoxamine 5'-phosphate oxidase family protein [Shimia sp. MMG029]
MQTTDTPFHKGERAAQLRAGAGDMARRVAPFIRDFMPDQHRAFYQDQPFLVVASGDAEGRVWATIVEGSDGFIRSPDAHTLTLAGAMDPQDPLAKALTAGADIGVVGIELATRRRNRLSGRTRPTDAGFAIDIRQTFGNCPQYISERDWWRVPHPTRPTSQSAAQLSAAQIAHIQAADTLFIGSGHHSAEQAASNGYDASHRGGAPGFVQVVSPTRLRIPDYSGNNFFNTIGNLIEDPRVGLLFVDFATGGLLHVSGRATIDWAPQEARDPSALRVIEVTIERVLDRREALGLRWSKTPMPTRKLVVTAKTKEAEDITSFTLSAQDGAPLAPFKAGQHLPIALEGPTQRAKLRRSYSLSGPAHEGSYRITVKREPQGLASRMLHSKIAVGDVIDAKPPAGDFVIPDNSSPLVLISAGVGLTPMVAMLHEALHQNPNRPVWFLHGTRNRRHHALRTEVAKLISDAPNATSRVFYSQPDPDDLLGQHYDAQGRITAQEVLALTAGAQAHYLLCGPAGFVTALTSGLEAQGVPMAQIHSETFGG